MVAKIKSGKSLIGALNYNERKISKQKAELIGAAGYFKEAADLNFYEKLLRLTDLAERNERTKTNTVHISLNFANGEDLPSEKLQAIAKDYMQGIGFEMQPYLVYRHYDAGHPHVHIVTTNIKSDGYRISLHYLGQNESEKARKAIEIKYGLVKAEEQQQQKPNLKEQLSAADYGKDETKRVITNSVNYVVRAYKFTSIPELNAVLGKYNIQADRGSKYSRMYANEGLVYWILDKQGNKIGVPIKASSLYGKPTLKTLEEKFKLNETLRKPHKADLIKAIDTLLSQPLTFRDFQKALGAKDIQVIFRRNDEGRLYGITFIDQKNKAVFNGSDLGKAYSANALGAVLKADPIYDKNRQQHQHDPFTPEGIHQDTGAELLDILFKPEQDDIAALNKFKRKKRKGLNL